LVDTGAQVSLIKESNDMEKIDKNNIIKLTGISGGHILSLGKINTEFFVDDLACALTLHVVTQEFPIPTDGIIGTDALKEYGMQIDYGENTITLNLKQFGIKTLKLEPIENIITNINYIDTTNFFDSSKIIFKILNFKTTSRTTTIINEIENSNKNLPQPLKKKLENLISKYQDIFGLEQENLTAVNFYKQTLRVKDNIPIYIKGFRTPQALKETFDKEIQRLLKSGVIEPSTSEYSAPAFLVPKKALTGTNEKRYRLVIDYRELNKKLIGDVYPIPHLEEILDSLSNNHYFSTIDMLNGFHQIELENNSRDFTSFNTPEGSYRFRRTPFGLKTSPASFQRMANLAFEGLIGKVGFLYLDDIIIKGRDESDHLKNIEEIFIRCRERNLKLNPKKCVFFRTEITYLGHLCTENGIKIDPEKINPIRNYPMPRNADEVKRFVAFLNYYRRFVPKFSTISAPLNNLTKKNVAFIWTDECSKAFYTLKDSLTKAPILKYPNFNKIFYIYSDASMLGVGGMLAQKYGNEEFPIAYFSKKFTLGESRKSVIEQELLGIFFTIKHFNPYILGRYFIVRSDHRPLIHLFSLKNPSSRLTRIRLELAEYEFHVEYIKGKDNVQADALSRLSIDTLKRIPEECQILRVTTRAMSNNKEEKISKTQISDETLNNPRVVISADNNVALPCLRFFLDKNNKHLRMDIQSAQRSLYKDLLRKINTENTNDIKGVVNWKNYLLMVEAIAIKMKFKELKILNNDVIFNYITAENLIKLASKSLKNTTLIISRAPSNVNDEVERTELIRKYHDDRIQGGHTGVKRTYAKLRAKYFWKSMKKEISKYIRNCHKCNVNKKFRNTKEKLILTRTPVKPFDIVQVDLMGPLPITEKENKYVLTVQDELTNYLILIPIANKEAKTVADNLLKNVILVYGPMKTLKSDMGSEFVNKCVQELLQTLKIDQKLSTPYRHQTVGKIERSHRVINAYIRNFLEDNEWDELLPFCSFAYNTTPNSNHFYTPYELLFSQNPNVTEEFLNGKVEPCYNPENYALETKFRLQVALSRARHMITKEKELRKIEYDRKINPINLKIGELIYVSNEERSKLEPWYKGPYKIIKILDNNNIVIENPKNKEQKKIHKNRIKYRLTN
jgi:hypothetical protein